jgi:hypothetical protein
VRLRDDRRSAAAYRAESCNELAGRRNAAHCVDVERSDDDDGGQPRCRRAGLLISLR